MAIKTVKKRVTPTRTEKTNGKGGGTNTDRAGSTIENKRTGIKGRYGTGMSGDYTRETGPAWDPTTGDLRQRGTPTRKQTANKERMTTGIEQSIGALRGAGAGDMKARNADGRGKGSRNHNVAADKWLAGYNAENGENVTRAGKTNAKQKTAIKRTPKK